MKAIYLKDKAGNKVVTVPYYRVGDLFLTTIATNPSEYLGGTWELFGPGRTLVCVDTSDSDFNTVKKTGGASRSNYTPQGSNAGTAITVDQMPSHSHNYKYNVGNGGYASAEVINAGTTAGYAQGSSAGGAWYCWTEYRGGGKTHNHTFTGTAATLSRLQKYITCYIWIRTA